MNQIKRIIKYPIKKTFVIVAVTLVAYILLTSLVIYLSRLQYTLHPNDMHPDRTFSILFVIETILGDFRLLSRLVLEFAIIAMIAQLIYKITQKN
jgi:hypothetical protein